MVHNKRSFVFPTPFILIPIGFFFLYLITSAGNTPFNYFVRLADAFIRGRYWLTENPSWLSELIPAGNGKFFVAYPPMPAILLTPFIYFLGQSFPQQILAHLIGAGIVFLTMKLSFQVKKDINLAIWSGLLAGAGTIIWFLSSTGSSWYLGQISACFFLIAALREGLKGQRSFLMGVLIGAAYLSRIHTILSLPIFFYLCKKGNTLRKYFFLFLGFLPFLTFNFIYNYLRFGVIWDKAYALIPNLFSEPWYAKGLFHPSYILSHLRIIFTAIPIIKNTFPYIIPSWAGLAIWITTPVFIFSFLAPFKEKVVKLSWLSIILIALVIFSHGTTGFSQFGYRFAVDFYPFLIFLTIKGVAKTGLKWFHWALLLLGVIVNAWGVIFINKLGWVSF